MYTVQQDCSHQLTVSFKQTKKIRFAFQGCHSMNLLAVFHYKAFFPPTTLLHDIPTVGQPHYWNPLSEDLSMTGKHLCSFVVWVHISGSQIVRLSNLRDG